MKILTRKQWTIASVALAMLAGFFVYRAVRADPRLAELREKRDQLMGKIRETKDPEEQKKLWGDFREAMKDLMPAQRQALREDARKRRIEEEKRYFAMSEEEKVKWLDERIDRMESMRERWESMAEKKGGDGATAGNGGFGRKENWSNLTAEEKENRRKQALDNSTPEERARRDQIRKDMAARREQRGLPPMNIPFMR